jgi:hypothetical protein
MGSNNKYVKHGVNDIRKYCSQLVKDFFLFCDGRPKQIKTMVWMDDIKQPMPPKKEQMAKMLKRLQVIWKKFCRDAILPRTTENLFITMMKAEWNRKSKEQKAHQLKIQKMEDPQP